MKLQEMMLELEDFGFIQETMLDGQLILDVQSYTFLPQDTDIKGLEEAINRVENMFFKKINKIKSLLGDVER